MQSAHVLQFLILLGVHGYFSNAQLCFGTPSDNEMKVIFTNLYTIPNGAILEDVYYTCMAQASLQFRYRQFSVIVTYTHNGMVTAKQFEVDCVSGSYMGRVDSVTDVPPSFNYTSITTRTDCSSCNNTADNNHHCEACDTACNTGLMRCTGPGSGDCCPFFSGTSCVTSCESEDLIAIEFTNFECFSLSCTLPDNNTILSLLKEYTSSAVSLRSDPHYTCLSQGLNKGTYDEASIVVEYTDSVGVDKVAHIYVYCNSEVWQTTGPSDAFFELPGPNYNGSIGLRTDCSTCFPQSRIGPENPCQTCPDHCGVGLNRCNNKQCCVAFEEDGFCKVNLNCLKKNFVANEDNNYTCSCSCPDGHTLSDSTNCTCTLTDICVADNPCNNNGVCILDTAPDQYTCNCTGTGYTGTNCTVFSPTSTSIIAVISSSSQTTSTTVQYSRATTASSVIKSSAASSAMPSPTNVPSTTTQQCLPAKNYKIEVCIENEREVATDCCPDCETFGQTVLDSSLKCINTNGCPSPVIVYDSCKSKGCKNRECRPSGSNVIKQCIKGTLMCGACEEVIVDNNERSLGRRSLHQIWWRNGELQEMEANNSVNRIERMAKSKLLNDCPSVITINSKEYSKTKLKTKKEKGKYCGLTKVKGKDVCDCPTTCPL